MGAALRLEEPSDMVEVPGNSAFDRVPGASFTITAWFNRGGAAFGHSGLVAVHWGPVPQYYGLEPRFDNGEWQLSFWDGVNHVGQVAVPLVEGNWRHLAAVIDGGTNVRLYLDGALVGQGTAIDSAKVATSLTMGSIPGFVPHGDLDEVHFYTRALTASEIADDMQL
jgi:hypothetical protein